MVREMQDTYVDFQEDGQRPVPPPMAKAMAGAAVLAGGVVMILARQRRRHKKEAAARAAEMQARTLELARKAPAKIKDAIGVAARVASSVPIQADDVSARAQDITHGIGGGLKAWGEGLREGRWQAWAGTLGGVWVLIHLDERRHLKRLTRVLSLRA
jgi:hypothetical protein